MQIRASVDSEIPAISKLIEIAFGADQGLEIAQLTVALLQDASAYPLLSLVATQPSPTDQTDIIIGYILLTKAEIANVKLQVNAAILAPLAVHPAYQAQGIGTQLIAQALMQQRTAGVDLIFVLGYPSYYAKQGFTPAGQYGFTAPYLIPVEHADAWMLQALKPEIIGQFQGQVICANALNDPRHWHE